MRTFDTWANRDTADWKLEYCKYINPLCDYSFSVYMNSKQIIDWEKRDGDNRQKWIPSDSLFDSLTRHIEILKLLSNWYDVYEVKKDQVVRLIVRESSSKIGIIEESFDFVEKKDIITELNAIRFNSEALKLYYLTNNNETH